MRSLTAAAMVLRHAGSICPTLRAHSLVCINSPRMPPNPVSVYTAMPGIQSKNNWGANTQLPPKVWNLIPKEGFDKVQASLLMFSPSRFLSGPPCPSPYYKLSSVEPI